MFLLKPPVPGWGGGSNLDATQISKDLVAHAVEFSKTAALSGPAGIPPGLCALASGHKKGLSEEAQEAGSA